MHRAAAILLTSCLLAACGQKGALYLPGDEREQVGGNARAVPQQSPIPAPATTTAAGPATGATTDEAAARPNPN